MRNYFSRIFKPVDEIVMFHGRLRKTSFYRDIQLGGSRQLLQGRNIMFSADKQAKQLLEKTGLTCLRSAALKRAIQRNLKRRFRDCWCQVN